MPNDKSVFKTSPANVTLDVNDTYETFAQVKGCRSVILIQIDTLNNAQNLLNFSTTTSECNSTNGNIRTVSFSFLVNEYLLNLLNLSQTDAAADKYNDIPVWFVNHDYPETENSTKAYIKVSSRIPYDCSKCYGTDAYHGANNSYCLNNTQLSCDCNSNNSASTTVSSSSTAISTYASSYLLSLVLYTSLSIHILCY